MLQIKRHILSFFLLSVLCIAFSPHSVHAQTILFNPAKIYIGTRHGTTVSMINFYPKIDQNPLLGYIGGLAFRYITEKHMGLQIEVNYSERGWQENTGNYSRKLTYIEFPLLTHIYIGNINRFTLNLGPKVSYLLNESILINKVENPTEEQHIKPVYFPFEYGITAGLGYNIHTKKAGVFELEVRAYYGLSDVFANLNSDYFRNSNHLNASVTLAYFFQLTGKKDK